MSVPQTAKTLHETVQIGIQTIPEVEETERPLSEDEFEGASATGQNKRRRRTFAAIDDELAPYNKKATRTTTLMDLQDERRKLQW